MTSCTNISPGERKFVVPACISTLRANSADIFDLMIRCNIDWANRASPELTSDEAWFWTEEWQKRYAAAEKDIENKNFRDFETIDEVISFLHGQKKKKSK